VPEILPLPFDQRAEKGSHPHKIIGSTLGAEKGMPKRSYFVTGESFGGKDYYSEHLKEKAAREKAAKERAARENIAK